jgi:hypothetical protein
MLPAKYGHIFDIAACSVRGDQGNVDPIAASLRGRLLAIESLL